MTLVSLGLSAYLKLSACLPNIKPLFGIPSAESRLSLLLTPIATIDSKKETFEIILLVFFFVFI